MDDLIASNFFQDLDLKILDPRYRISAPELASKLPNARHLLADVRTEQEFHMCSIGGAVNYPIDKFEANVQALAQEVRNGLEVTIVCRRGNDSQLATEQLLALLGDSDRARVRDVTGGLHAWARLVDKHFPVY